MIKPNLESYLKTLPSRPGIYLFKDKDGEVIYVGKASNLRNRVKSYFKQGANLPEKTEQLSARVDKIEFVVTESEIAALVLECQQIKKYMPRFNVLLKDDKSFPYIKVDVKNEWPTISLTRRRYSDGAKYIGRVPSAWSARQTYELVKRIFPLRSCNKVITGKEPRPCLKYHIGRCLSPCTGLISKEEYSEMVRRAVAFLEGKEKLVLAQLKNDMKKASENMQYEKAAQIRDQIQAIHRVIESNRIPFNTRGEMDVIGLARDGSLACVRIFSIKDGRLLCDEHFIIERAGEKSDAQLIESFIKLYYSSPEQHIPRLILLQSPIIEAALIGRWLSDRKGARVELRLPTRGTGSRLVAMAGENAAQELQAYKTRQAYKPEYLSVLSNLKDLLKLPQLPRRIEAYDISNIQGTTAVGSMVVFENGLPRPSHYRRFKIRMVKGADDYAMMREVLQRRFKAAVSDEKWAILPDLVLIDGGKGHLNAALFAMQEAGADRVPAISLAKENEEVFLPGRPQPVLLDRSSQELQLLQRVRDEAHRFAVTYHRKLRSKKSRESALDSIGGIGPARKRALIKRFGSVREIRKASVSELASVNGITQALARKILESLV